MITSYEMMAKKANGLTTVHWDTLVVDEGHRLRKSDSKTFQRLEALTTRYDAAPAPAGPLSVPT